MAKKRTAVSQVSTPRSDTVTIDMQTMMIPLSILLAGFMIAIGLFFGLRNTSTTNNNNTNTNTDTNNDGTNVDDGSVDELSLDDDPYKGDKDSAKVAIVEFTDYECPYCKQHYEQTFSDLIENYVDTGDAIYVVRDYPLSFHDPMATNEALAAQCVFAQDGSGDYFKYHDLIFANTTSNGNGLTEAQLRDFAEEVGVNMGDFDECYDGRDFDDEIDNDIAQGSAAGISGTPGFIIGLLSEDGKSVVDGTILAGAYPYADFQTVLDGLLGK
jgi:protein-disulfide isomerase